MAQEAWALIHRSHVVALAVAVLVALVGLTAVGLLADGALGTAPLGTALGVGLGALLAAAIVTRATLAAFRRLAPLAEPEEAIE